jgi:hypothetical protein
MLTHIVCWKYKAETTPEMRADHRAKLMALPKIIRNSVWRVNGGARHLFDGAWGFRLLRPWQSVRPGVEVKVLPQEEELYLFAQSQVRLNKERAMRRRQLKALWKRLGQLQQMKLTYCAKPAAQARWS